MTPKDVVRDATTRSLSDPDGDPDVLRLRPGLTNSEIDAFARTLPCPLPEGIRDLLTYCSGFERGAADVVDFTGRDCSFEYRDIFPHGHPIAADGFGNFWVVDAEDRRSAFRHPADLRVSEAAEQAAPAVSMS